VEWEKLTTPAFIKAVEEAEGVCLLPLGVVETHGDHLPLGTDVFLGRAIALRAAELEPAVVFPSYYFTEIFEAQHLPGAIAINSRLMLDLLQNVCDEIARNGLKKIVLVNAHGGNRYFLPYFIMIQLERKRDYVIYLPKPDVTSDELKAAWESMRESTIRDEHGGERETSMVMATHPELVDHSPLPNDKGEALNRLAHLEENNLYTAIGWYADFPHHYSGRGEFGTAEKGEVVLDHRARDLARLIRVVKDDDAAPALQREFFERI
jgi:creatinine amidohydrolase